MPDMTRIGFIGLGIMGQPMAFNLLRSGRRLVVYNRSMEKTEPLTRVGAEVADSPARVAAQVGVVILMLTGPEAIDRMLFGPDGFCAAGGGGGKIVVNMGTVQPEYSRELAKRLGEEGGVLVDAPVSGSKKPAEDGSLVILASGPEEAVRGLEPIFLAMGKKVIYCGEAGLGSALKMSVNLLLAAMMTGLCEAMGLAAANGLDPAVMLETVQAGPLGCGLFSLKTPMLLTGEYPPQFPLKHMLKDLRFICANADQRKAVAPGAALLRTLFDEAGKAGLGGLDFAAIHKLFTAER